MQESVKIKYRQLPPFNAANNTHVKNKVKRNAEVETKHFIQNYFLFISNYKRLEEGFSLSKFFNGLKLASFCLFPSFSQHNDKYMKDFTINRRSIDGVLRIQTWDHRMVGADQYTELWRPPSL